MFLTLHLVWQHMDDRAVRLLTHTKLLTGGWKIGNLRGGEGR